MSQIMFRAAAAARTFPASRRARGGASSVRRTTAGRRSLCRPTGAIAPPPDRTDAEARAEEALLAGDDSDGTIAGFTKQEWACIQTPARYLGNEIGAMHKDWDSAEVRFTMA
jgi:hypothetical protein